MPRMPRTVLSDIPYHITQRGNRREQVFFSDGDRKMYLRWLREYTTKHAVEVLAYCLMPNHVHLVAAPATPDALHRVLKPLHMRYAQRVNRTRQLSGHVWQGRYFSAALDDDYLWAAIRYVETNPVRAKLTDRAEEFRWSSAAAHCGLRSDPVLTALPKWQDLLASVHDWPTWLDYVDDPPKINTLRRFTMKGLPCGSESFVAALERAAGRMLRYRSRGRPKGQKGDATLFPASPLPLRRTNPEKG